MHPMHSMLLAFKIGLPVHFIAFGTVCMLLTYDPDNLIVSCSCPSVQAKC
jgi:hypothetical protein